MVREKNLLTSYKHAECCILKPKKKKKMNPFFLPSGLIYHFLFPSCVYDPYITFTFSLSRTFTVV